MLSKLLRLTRRCIDLAVPFGRKRLVFVAIVIVANGIFEVIGVTSILPFFALATDSANPEKLADNRFAQLFLESFPEMTTNDMLVWAGLFSILMLFLANAMGLFCQVVRVKYGFSFGHSLRTRMLESIAERPYGYFLNRNSGSFLQKTIDDVNRFINEVFLPLLDVISRAVAIVFLISAIVFADPVIAIGAALLFGTFYATVFFIIRSRSLAIGADLRVTNKRLMIAATQFFGSIKTTMVHNKSRYFINEFAANSERQARLIPRFRLYSYTPRCIIEPLAYGGLVAIVVWMAFRDQPFVEILPRLSVMAVAGVRLIPSFQSLYSQLNQVTTMHYTLGELESEIHEASSHLSEHGTEPEPEVAPVTFEREIKLVDVSFQYPGAPEPVIKDFNLTLPRNSSVGIIGPTGSGKSTLIDTVLGLHEIQSGALKVDDRSLIKADMRAWRELIGYVPQDIFLTDASIAQNIAFGVPEAEIDHKRLIEVAKAAQIHDFVENELPEKWETVTGERGVRLSGGQRQRIGLARALYTKPEVLVLDEATSALDVKTEAEVMRAINALHGKLTIIIVAHRLSTIEACDQVVDLAKLKES